MYTCLLYHNGEHTLMWKCDKALLVTKSYKTESLFTENACFMHKMQMLLCMCYITELMVNDTLVRQLSSVDLRQLHFTKKKKTYLHFHTFISYCFLLEILSILYTEISLHSLYRFSELLQSCCVKIQSSFHLFSGNMPCLRAFRC